MLMPTSLPLHYTATSGWYTPATDHGDDPDGGYVPVPPRFAHAAVSVGDTYIILGGAK